ncbi:hypothetical protein HY479_00010 [Candidatus Uhrbacteria bacterium]|nr:hypothetical protein [Candidatus Uhrbacteria bacterium]
MRFFTTTWALLASCSLALSAGLAPLPVFAQGGLGGVLKGGLDKAAPAELKGGETDPATILGNIVAALIGFVGALLFFYMLYGGYLWMTAGGAKEKVQSAQLVIKNAIIGIVIVALSYAIANFVIGNLANVTKKTQTAPEQQAPKS